ncbi:uncharacterized protein Ecym_2668 [Eremothecium cymbalariae DBVPG|uniref:Uncharacterized protein n=1 Tax=Eremothecium cymbalariae (strain CBS 270.75 / DBVPG 7215 / KCTC 17166 / NRRL Y-17582) TaxID=931890 RepID=G8JNV3_ERECY|nr:Hypothetical protein Ecym_2668 [Eremothecium cymbalariae DBVPG\
MLSFLKAKILYKACFSSSHQKRTYTGVAAHPHTTASAAPGTAISRPDPAPVPLPQPQRLTPDQPPEHDAAADELTLLRPGSRRADPASGASRCWPGSHRKLNRTSLLLDAATMREYTLALEHLVEENPAHDHLQQYRLAVPSRDDTANTPPSVCSSPPSSFASTSPITSPHCSLSTASSPLSDVSIQELIYDDCEEQEKYALAAAAVAAATMSTPACGAGPRALPGGPVVCCRERAPCCSGASKHAFGLPPTATVAPCNTRLIVVDNPIDHGLRTTRPPPKTLHTECLISFEEDDDTYIAPPCNRTLLEF